MQAIAPISQRKARIEIIPLIDIMFFLLASFMLVSLTMVRLQGLHVSLPGILPPSRAVISPDEVLRLEVTPAAEGKERSVFALDRQIMNGAALVEAIKKRMVTDQGEARETKLFIVVGKDARHVNLIEALDLVKEAGLQRFSFSLKPGNITASAASAP